MHKPQLIVTSTTSKTVRAFTSTNNRLACKCPSWGKKETSCKITKLENKNLHLEAYSRRGRGNTKLENSKRILIWTRIKKTRNQSLGADMPAASRYSSCIVLIRRHKTEGTHRKVVAWHESTSSQPRVKPIFLKLFFGRKENMDCRK